jgi:4-hydroxy-3-methylbut-2-en-1-yl diphosphate reductase
MARARPPLHVLIAAPRGFCAGVDRAIQIVELALERFGAPVYVRHEIVHNRFVVDRLKANGGGVRRRARRGARRPAGGLLGPRGSQVGAGGRARARPRLRRRNLPARLEGPSPGRTADRRRSAHPVHRPFRPSGGHRHVRPGSRGLDHPRRDRRGSARGPRSAIPTAWPSSPRPRFRSTTRPRSSRLKRRFPNIRAPRSEDICYATSNRQAAVKAIAPKCDKMLVIGAPTAATRCGCPRSRNG